MITISYFACKWPGRLLLHFCIVGAGNVASTSVQSPDKISFLLHDNGPCHPGMIGASIVKFAWRGEGETKGATGRQVPAIKRPIVTGDRMSDLRRILPDHSAAYRDREGSRAEVSTADHNHSF